MRKYLFAVMAIGLLSALAFTSCKKAGEKTFPLQGTVWIGEPIYDLLTNRYYNGDVMYIMSLTGGASSGTGTMLTINNHISRAAISITSGLPLTWNLSGDNLSMATGFKGTWNGSLSYSNENVNFAKVDTTYLGGYLAFDNITLDNSLATKVFRGTFVKVGTTTPVDCVWIFLSDLGWKMIVPSYPVTIYPLSQYKVDNTGNLLVNFFGGTASSAVPIDYTHHSGTYTASNDSIVYNSINVPAANAYPNSYNWRGMFRLKQVK